MMPDVTLPLDNEGCRLFALYEVSSAKEVAATYQLLHPSHRLLHPEYMKLLGDLRATILAKLNIVTMTLVPVLEYKYEFVLAPVE